MPILKVSRAWFDNTFVLYYTPLVGNNRKEKKTITAALVLGALSISANWVLCWLPLGSQALGTVLGIGALIIGLISIVRIPEKKELAVTAIVLGFIGTAYSLVSFFACGLPIARETWGHPYLGSPAFEKLFGG